MWCSAFRLLACSRTAHTRASGSGLGAAAYTHVRALWRGRGPSALFLNSLSGPPPRLPGAVGPLSSSLIPFFFVLTFFLQLLVQVVDVHCLAGGDVAHGKQKCGRGNDRRAPLEEGVQKNAGAGEGEPLDERLSFSLTRAHCPLVWPWRRWSVACVRTHDEGEMRGAPIAGRERKGSVKAKPAHSHACSGLISRQQERDTKPTKPCL